MTWKNRWHHQTYRFLDRSYSWLSRLSSLEHALIKDRLPPLEKPIFVCGLARSGTSMVTRLLNQHPQTGSFLYKDLPFLASPYAWSFVQDLYYWGVKPSERAHRDGLLHDPQAPEALEEFIWRKELPDYEKGQFCAWLESNVHFTSLEERLACLRRTILLIRGASRYLVKGNYNLHRIPYLLAQYPEAKIVLCIRSPLEHAQSLARVHRLFMEQARKNPLIGEELSILGHYEFGPQRKPILADLGGFQKTQEYWAQGREIEGYLCQWRDVYRRVYEDYFSKPALRDRCLILSQEALQKAPEKTMPRLFTFCDLETAPLNLDLLGAQIHQKNHYDPPMIEDEKLLEEAETLYRTMGEL